MGSSLLAMLPGGTSKRATSRQQVTKDATGMNPSHVARCAMAMILKEKKAQDQAIGSQKVPQKPMHQLHARWRAKNQKKAEVIGFWQNLSASKNPPHQVAAYGGHLQAIRGQAFVCHLDVGARCHPDV
ncbi:hypothetical protein [Acidovorax sp. CF316]|uniref:hypothetical protein n=1 Tax=Acidovorax sp. CF316 TaxID=1144317 RepID=UPI0011B260CE|nr:hypothetical protein [Acidovorax sp. CF316]